MSMSADIWVTKCGQYDYVFYVSRILDGGAQAAKLIAAKPKSVSQFSSVSWIDAL
jgi:hypothetical protein